MDTSLRIFAICVIVVYFVVVFRLLKKQKFLLKYSLLWMFAGIIMLLVIICPNVVIWITGKLGIKVASNGIFAVCILLEIIIMISMTAAISDFGNRIKILTQNSALMEKRIRDLEKKINCDDEENLNERK